MSEVRVTYSGLISFVVGIGSVFTGLIFTVIVTRRLTPDEFGEWGLIGALTGYVLMISPVISYWNTREIARGIESGKTAFQTSILFSFGAILIYFIIARLVGAQADVDLDLLLLASIMIPVEFVKYSLTSICHGFKPQAGEYGLLIFEFTKIPVALILIYFLDMGLAGAILTSTLASSASVIALIILSGLARSSNLSEAPSGVLHRWPWNFCCEKNNAAGAFHPGGCRTDHLQARQPAA